MSMASSEHDSGFGGQWLCCLLVTYVPMQASKVHCYGHCTGPSLHGWLVNEFAYFFFNRRNCDRDEAPVYRSVKSMSSFIHHEYNPRPANHPRKGLHLRLEIELGSSFSKAIFLSTLAWAHNVQSI